MADHVMTRLLDDVLVVTISHPPVNALSVGVRRELLAAIRAASDTPAIAILITGAGRHFIAGADIREFGKPPQEPRLIEVCNAIEDCPKPVIAAIHGAALGGGLEVALAAHYRIASPDARLGFPEVNLGLLPGGGGTQRAPRLVGAAAALKLMLSGRPVGAADAVKMGLLDRVTVDADGLQNAALDYAHELCSTHAGPRRTRDAERLADKVTSRKAVTDARDHQIHRHPGPFAPYRILDAVGVAVERPFEEGLRFERQVFEQCMRHPQRAALVHVFFAERATAKIPEATRAKPRDVQTLGVVGGGTMGSGIAVAGLKAGLHVTMVEQDAASAARGRAKVEKILGGSVAKGRMTPEAHDRLLARFVTGDYDALAQADLVVEAVFEDMAAKRSVFVQLDRICKPGAILASNTSYLDINELAASTSRPTDVLGLHFFSPAHVMKLVEVVVGRPTADDVVASGFALAQRLGKVPVRAGVCDGFIGNRILATYRQVAYRLVEDGATPYAIDAAVRHFGYPIGPFQMFDMAGGDIGWAMRNRRASTRDPRDRYVAIPDRLCEEGWFGQKTGRGWYRYPEGARAGIEDPEVLALIDAERERAGVVPRNISEDEILERYLAAMINAAANVVADGTALRPLDVDVVLVHGYGFPRYRGGPMHYADAVGLPDILADIRRYAREDARFWRPSPLLEQLVERGADFASLNQNTEAHDA